MRRTTIAVFSTLSALLIILTSSVFAQSRSVIWNRWDVLIDQIDTTNNQFRVYERYDIQFSGTYRFGQRMIPYNNLEQINNIEVYQAGQKLQSNCSGQAGTYCVKNEQDGVSIVYNFLSPITNATESFLLSYTIVGALRVYDGGDQLWWVAVTKDKFGFPVRESTIIVNLPDGFAPREGIDRVETYGASGDITVNGSLVTAVASEQISPHEPFEIRVQYPHDHNARIASWQYSFDDKVNFGTSNSDLLFSSLLVFVIVAGAGFLVLGLLIGLYYVVSWYSRQLEPKLVIPVPEYLSEPPSDLPPAIAARLVDKKAETRHVLSTLLDLGNRGYVVIDEKHIDNGFGGARDFVFKRTDKNLSDLQPFEKNFIDAFFGFIMLERPLSSLKHSFYKDVPKLHNALNNEIVFRGFHKANTEISQSYWMAGGVTLLIIAAMAYGAIDSPGSVMHILPYVIGIIGMAMSVGSLFMSAKTLKGVEEAAKWRAFREYLLNLQQYSTLEEASSKFQEYLPYAVAFGLDRSWITRFSNAPNLHVPSPDWYFPHYYGGYTAGTPLHENIPLAFDRVPGKLVSADGVGGLNDLSSGLSDGLDSISDGLTNMLNVTAVNLISRPVTSIPGASSSGSWGFGGGFWSGGGGGGGFGGLGGSGGGFSGFG